MLKEILSVTGKPGLFKLISQGKNMLIVESLIDGKRMPAFTKDKVVSLADIAIFTENEEVPLIQVFEKLRVKENSAAASIDPKADNDKLRAFMLEVLPEYDRDRVYPSDIRKLINWYNILINSGFTSFVETETTETTESKVETGKE